MMNLSNDTPKTNNIACAKGKIVIVTGSSKGIGKAIALAFAKSKEYYGIAVNGIKMQEAQEVADQIKSVGCGSIAIEADISKEGDCIKLIEGAKKRFGRIDVLVNNAGIQQEVPFEDTTTEEWYKIIGVYLTGTFVCSREVVKHMEKQDPKAYSRGDVINFGAVNLSQLKDLRSLVG